MAKITYIHEGESEGTARIVIGSENIDSTNFVNLVDSNIHAIQWDGTSGEIEYKDNRPNAIISDISSYGFETVFANEKQAIANAEAEAEAQAPAETYEDKRSREFPRIEDQLDDIYHNGLEGWKSTIKAIKDKYPKE
jgi:hypothetical protein